MMIKRADFFNGIELYRNKKTKEVFRSLGVCRDTETGGTCIVYTPWNSSGDDCLTRFCTTWERFKKDFEFYDIEGISLVPTAAQDEKDLGRWVERHNKKRKQPRRHKS